MRNRLSKAPTALQTLLDDPQVRRADHEGQTAYVADDVVKALIEPGFTAESWAGLKAREPKLAGLADRLELPEASGDLVDVLSLDGVLRLVQSVSSPRAEKIKSWLASASREYLDELQNPELTWVRLQKAYDQQGYSNAWVQKRLRGMAARQELVREWARRGIADSEEYRQLTNTIMDAAFGMDVNAYRRFKGLVRTSHNLRDHMTDLELTLTMLGETTAVALHRNHNSQGFEQLQADVRDAGEVTRVARQEIERRGGHAVISSRLSPTAA